MTQNLIPHQKPLDEDIYNFLKDLLNPEMYGFAVTTEVRDRARELLEKERVEAK
jgi:hypothetical protein